MDRTELLKKVIDILRPYAEDPKVLDDATEDSEVDKELGIDSAHMVDASMEMEDAFDIMLEDEDIVQWVTLREVIDEIEKKMA